MYSSILKWVAMCCVAFSLEPVFLPLFAFDWTTLNPIFDQPLIHLNDIIPALQMVQAEAKKDSVPERLSAKIYFLALASDKFWRYRHHLNDASSLPGEIIAIRSELIQTLRFLPSNTPELDRLLEGPMGGPLFSDPGFGGLFPMIYPPPGKLPHRDYSVFEPTQAYRHRIWAQLASTHPLAAALLAHHMNDVSTSEWTGLGGLLATLEQQIPPRGELPKDLVAALRKKLLTPSVQNLAFQKGTNFVEYLYPEVPLTFAALTAAVDSPDQEFLKEPQLASMSLRSLSKKIERNSPLNPRILPLLERMALLSLNDSTTDSEESERLIRSIGITGPSLVPAILKRSTPPQPVTLEFLVKSSSTPLDEVLDLLVKSSTKREVEAAILRGLSQRPAHGEESKLILHALAKIQDRFFPHQELMRERSIPSLLLIPYLSLCELSLRRSEDSLEIDGLITEFASKAMAFSRRPLSEFSYKDDIELSSLSGKIRQLVATLDRMQVSGRLTSNCGSTATEFTDFNSFAASKRKFHPE